MRFRADLHIHTDFYEHTSRWHGDFPERIAGGIVESGIDVYAITEHNKISENVFRTQEEVERLIDGTNREILNLFGVEMTISYGSYRYHIGYIFEDQFDRNNLPEMPGIRSDIKELEEFKKSYPGVVILNHPTWKDHVSGDNDVNVTQELIESGLIDGVEILNGTILHNAASMRVSRSAINMFIEARKNGVNVAAIGASDAHVGINNPRMGNLVGSAVTEFCSTYADGVFDAIRNGGNNTLAIAVKDSVRKKVSSILKDQNNRQAHKFVRY